jgi:hypothetical protein
LKLWPFGPKGKPQPDTLPGPVAEMIKERIDQAAVAAPPLMVATEPAPPATDRKKPGLETKWAPGEQLPWKGLWFEVETVSFDRLTLKPVGTTWQRWKQIQKAKEKSK